MIFTIKYKKNKWLQNSLWKIGKVDYDYSKIENRADDSY